MITERYLINWLAFGAIAIFLLAILRIVVGFFIESYFRDPIKDNWKKVVLGVGACLTIATLASGIFIYWVCPEYTTTGGAIIAIFWLTFIVGGERVISWKQSEKPELLDWQERVRNGPPDG